MDQRAIDWGKNRTTISIERLEQLHAERDEMADEIKRLRAKCASLTQFAETRRVQINELMDELAHYKTPNVES